MKRYIKYFLCIALFSFPYLVLGKVTCSNGDYSATIDMDKENLSLTDNTKILVASDYKYEVDYNADDKNIVHISNDGIITPINKGNTKINVIIKFLENDNKVGECTSVINLNVLSNDSFLKNLTLEELDISAIFQKDDFDYEVRLPYNYEKINIIAVPNDENATITGDGRRYLNEGNNVYEIIVKATDGSTSTYKITILREEANEDNSLKSLIVEGYELSPEFSKDVYEYNLNVSEKVDNITISAMPTYELAKIFGTGTFKLATGENKFFITVVAENNMEQKYTIAINKNTGNSKLLNLEINGYKLNKQFSSNEYIYHLTVNNNVEKLDIKTEVEDNEQVEIIGNEKLKVGENDIIIRVSSSEKGATTYKIIVTKLSLDEQKQVEKNDLLLKVLLIIFILSIIIMFTLITIFLKKNYKKSTKKIKINKKIKNR